MFFDSTIIIIIPAIIFSIIAQIKVSMAFKKYSQISNRRGITGAQVAAEIMQGRGTIAGVEFDKKDMVRNGILGVKIEGIGGSLTDHYDPSAKVLRLSESVYGSDSIAAVAVAAHEAGHALQHAITYPWLGLRSFTVPFASIANMAYIPLILAGIFIPSMFPAFINILIVLYIFVVFFTIVTLPVEFNASRRALLILKEGGYLAEDELPGAKKVLDAAALTYVAATLTAILTLVRLFLLRGRN
ncbi:MAG: zinc metallopeptidase [bacterium]